jgi:hypothetical protein
MAHQFQRGRAVRFGTAHNEVIVAVDEDAEHYARVTAPSLAESTSLQYFAITPVL